MHLGIVNPVGTDGRPPARMGWSENRTERERESNMGSKTDEFFCNASDGNSPPCDCEEEIAEMRQELATVRAQMASMTSETERRVDELHSQLHYWLNVTVNILKDHYSSFQTSKIYDQLGV